MNAAKTSFVESGEGEPVVCLLSENAAALMDALTDDFHVLQFAPANLQGSTAQARAESLMAAARARGLASFSLVAHGDDAGTALMLAATQPDAVQSLVLLSPAALNSAGAPADASLADKLGDIKTQTLTLFGTRSTIAPPAMGGHYKRALGACHLMYVYDADNTSSERLEAVSEAVTDFLRRREAFLVNNKDGRVHA